MFHNTVLKWKHKISSMWIWPWEKGSQRVSLKICLYDRSPKETESPLTFSLCPEEWRRGGECRVYSSGGVKRRAELSNNVNLGNWKSIITDSALGSCKKKGRVIYIFNCNGSHFLFSVLEYGISVRGSFCFKWNLTGIGSHARRSLEMWTVGKNNLNRNRIY